MFYFIIFLADFKGVKILSNDRISGESIRLSNVKKSPKNIDTSELINTTKKLSGDKKTELVNLICYLNIALRSRYSGLKMISILSILIILLNLEILK